MFVIYLFLIVCMNNISLLVKPVLPPDPEAIINREKAVHKATPKGHIHGGIVQTEKG